MSSGISTGRVETTDQFSLADARRIIRDLFAPRAWIYWCDFLATITAGHLCFGITRFAPEIIAALFPETTSPLHWAARALCFILTCILFYRAAMFTHELVHLPENQFRGFRIAWNLLCGLPFLIPSFTYYTHLDHHRRKSYGTAHDGEYLPLTSGSRWHVLVYLSQCFWVGPLVVFRFAVLTPLIWFSPRLRKVVYQRASSLVMDPLYLRPQPTGHRLWIIRSQEIGCFLNCLIVVVVPPLLLDRWAIAFVLQAYAVSVVLIFMNCVRTLAAHRYHSEGREGTFVEQMLDSVNIDSESVLAEIINPVGLRYHALHHLFPSLPYHNARQAHRRLMARLPANSPYRQTVERSVLSAIADLLRRSAAHRNRLQQRLDSSGPGTKAAA